VQWRVDDSHHPLPDKQHRVLQRFAEVMSHGVQ